MQSTDLYSRGRSPWKVSDLVFAAQYLIEKQLIFDWVEGEISNYTRAPSGHIYFVLKDNLAQIRCVLFRQRSQLSSIALKEGLGVAIRGKATIYGERGEFQINVDSIRLAGAGALYEAYQQLKSKLQQMGWFDPDHKQAIPRIPQKIGIVTSPQAAALQDVLTTLKRRLPSVPVILYPCSVQGNAASQEIAQAIRLANLRRETDVLIVCRGGGSIEDLWPFNEEIVAAALYESVIPTISGVGHEEDETICDLVADARASTPTAAAMLAVPERWELHQILNTRAQQLTNGIKRYLQYRSQKLDLLSNRTRHPVADLAQKKEKLRYLQQFLQYGIRQTILNNQQKMIHWQNWLQQQIKQRSNLSSASSQLGKTQQKLSTAMVQLIRAKQQHCKMLHQGLIQLSPQSVLARGYSIVYTPQGETITTTRQLQVGGHALIQFAQGKGVVRVDELTDESS